VWRALSAKSFTGVVALEPNPESAVIGGGAQAYQMAETRHGQDALHALNQACSPSLASFLQSS
jgi:hypothetical protein